MTTKDDRLEFEANKRAMALALGKDEEAFQQSLNTLVALDKYDYAYLWSWMGVPIIQMPADVMATQEVIWDTKPDIIIETGVARGGSMIFMASLLKVIGKGKVIGVDIDIRAHNRDSIETHPLSPLITLIEGPSTTAETLAKVKAEIPAGASVMIVLDSDHSRDHVLDELRSYGPLVTEGQYVVVADTLLGRGDMSQTPTKRSKIWYPGDEPYTALNAYLKETDRFETDEALNGKLVLSSSPGGYLKCIRK
ncbi:CmcI family methyltransferase [Rhizobium sp. MC63]|uniref:CmcI family methyltransferase n=1 Tax=Rhizobium mulingense TaxID=3031128 RepID=A0ACC6N1L3_9HYPH|nr:MULTISPECIES: CmcI family methyltransferase [unclassified Rhizobium]MDF0695712.1 CmcI family methyltransferase [Rhizobium sp. MC63]MEA3519330.1 CmcI family methyltransferase [Rhizobium sp. MJ31]MEB3043197.1 CmcI family methyltransferase [Rhizobium sp. MJ21]